MQLGQHFLGVGDVGLVEHMPGSSGLLRLGDHVVDGRFGRGVRCGLQRLVRHRCGVLLRLAVEFVGGLVEQFAEGRIAGGLVDLGELEAAAADVRDQFRFRRNSVLREVEGDRARPQPDAVGVPGARHRGGAGRIELVLLVLPSGQYHRGVLQVLAQRPDFLGRDRRAVGDHWAALLVVVVEDAGHPKTVGRFADPRLRDRCFGDRWRGGRCFDGIDDRGLGDRCFGVGWLGRRGTVKAFPHPFRDVLLGARVAAQLVDVRGARQRALPVRLGIEVDVDPVARWTLDDVEGTEPGAHIGPVHALTQALEDLLQLGRRFPGTGTAVLRGDLTQQVMVFAGGAILHRDLLPVLGSAL